MIADDEFTLTATVEPTDATEEIDWSVTPSDLLAVSYPNNKTANITALLKVGTAIVSVANKDRSSVATCTIQCSGGISVVSLNFQSVQGFHNLCVVSILKYPNKTARENSRDDYGDFTPTSQSTWIIKNSTESTVMSVTISGEECLGLIKQLVGLFGGSMELLNRVGLVLWIVIMNFIVYNLMEDKKYEYNNKRCKW